MTLVQHRRAFMTFVAAFACVVGGIAAPARAVPITPGQTVVYGPDAGGFLTGATILGQDLTNPGVNANPVVAGNLRNVVIREATGTLTFLYQYENRGTQGASSAIDAISVADYSGFTTDVGSLIGTPAPLAGTAANPIFVTPTASPNFPTNATRNSGAGSIIVFDAGPLAAGQTSQIFYVRTNATTFNQFGTGQVAASLAGFGSDIHPTKFNPSGTGVNPIPEPSTTAMLLGAGFIGLGYRTIRRRRLAA